MEEVGKTDEYAGEGEENGDEGGEAEGQINLGLGSVVGLYYEVLQVLTYTDASDIGIGDCGGTIVRVSGAVGRDGTTHICREEHEAETRFKS